MKGTAGNWRSYGSASKQVAFENPKNPQIPQQRSERRELKRRWFMAKIAMACPFSGKMCRDCAVYRGSHYYLCFKKEYRGCLLGDNGKNSKEKSVYGMKDLVVNVPVEILGSKKVITDVEVMLEEEEFGKFNKKAR